LHHALDLILVEIGIMAMDAAVHEQVLPGDIEGAQEFDPWGGVHEPTLEASVLDLRGMEAEVAGIQRFCVIVEVPGQAVIRQDGYVEEHLHSLLRKVSSFEFRVSS
jgi:hypothetical protein